MIRAHIGSFEITHIGCYELFCPYDILIITNIRCNKTTYWVLCICPSFQLEPEMNLYNCFTFELASKIALTLTWIWHIKNILPLEKYPPLCRWEKMTLITWIHVISHWIRYHTFIFIASNRWSASIWTTNFISNIIFIHKIIPWLLSSTFTWFENFVWFF